MQRGYTLLWRKVWANPVLCEPGRKFSRLEAWLYIINVQAAGMDDEKLARVRCSDLSRQIVCQTEFLDQAHLCLNLINVTLFVI
jgi:hypothetical protein